MAKGYNNRHARNQNNKVYSKFLESKKTVENALAQKYDPEIMDDLLKTCAHLIPPGLSESGMSVFKGSLVLNGAYSEFVKNREKIKLIIEMTK